jgi:MOSC domain-containing protein YiiM
MGEVVSVNVGDIDEAPWLGSGQPSAIDKRPVTTRVAVRWLGLDGDDQADKHNHGGREQAVYAYAREDLDWWAAQLGGELRDGVFGENLTVRGLDVNGALLGECWRVGSALIQVTAPRVPCSVFRYWMGRKGWVKRFTEAERTGAYFRVLEEGQVAPGDHAVVERRPGHGVTVTESFRAFHGDQDLMRRVLATPDRSAKWDEVAERVLRGSA